MIHAARSSLTLSLLTLSCSGESVTTAVTEPIRITGAQFREGDLPGKRPLTSEEIAAGKTLKKPYSTPIDVTGSILAQNEVGFSLGGRTSTDAYAVVFQAQDYGTGYWLLPVGSPDPANQGEFAWRARMDLGTSIGTGMRTLLVAAVDASGNAGTQRTFQFCVRNPIEDSLNSCLPTREPPALVVSLGWNNSADLDLQVLDASGAVIDRNNVHGSDPALGGALLRDANANCAPEGAPRENIVFSKKPPPGTYYVYVSLAQACGEVAAPFVVSTHISRSHGDEFEQVETFRVSSELLPQQANSDQNIGTFVTELTVK